MITATRGVNYDVGKPTNSDLVKKKLKGIRIRKELQTSKESLGKLRIRWGQNFPKFLSFIGAKMGVYKNLDIQKY